MKKIFLFCLSIPLLSTPGCTGGEFLFRFADDLAAAKVDKYFDLTSEQKKELKAEIRKNINTGKKEALPKVAHRLRQLEKEMHGNPAPETFAKAFAEIEKQVKGITTYFQDTTIRTSMVLSPEQIHHFAAEVREEIKEKEDDPEETVEKVEKRYRKSIEYFVGSMTRDQHKMLQKFLGQNPYPWRLQNLSQEYVVKQFVASAQNPASRRAFVEKFAKDYESVRLPEYRKALNDHQLAFISFLTNDFWGSLSEKQKATFKENLLARAEMLERIAKQ